MRVALITCRVLPEPDYDGPPLLAALAAAGHAAAEIAWDDPAARLEGFDVAVLRSCWNYHEQPRAFADWIERAARTTRLLNPPAVLHWNLHKGYLRQLARSGVAIVPTEFVAASSPRSFASVLDERGWDDVVVKPAISAGSARTRRFRRGEDAAAEPFLAANLCLGDMLIQPYLTSVDGAGERNLVWIDGELTHAVRKAPRFAGGQESVNSVAIDALEREFASRVMAAAPAGLAYARVDLMHGDAGEPLLSELELIEPSLHFARSPAATRRFVAMLALRASLPLGRHEASH